MSTSREDRCTLSPSGVAWSGVVGSLLPVRIPVVAPVPLLALVTLCFLFLLSLCSVSRLGWGGGFGSSG